MCRLPPQWEVYSLVICDMKMTQKFHSCATEFWFGRVSLGLQSRSCSPEFPSALNKPRGSTAELMEAEEILSASTSRCDREINIMQLRPVRVSLSLMFVHHRDIVSKSLPLVEGVRFSFQRGCSRPSHWLLISRQKASQIHVPHLDFSSILHRQHVSPPLKGDSTEFTDDFQHYLNVGQNRCRMHSSFTSKLHIT